MVRTPGILEVASNDLLTDPADSEPNPYFLEARPADQQDCPVSSRVPKYRSDLAFAAGFLALACILSRYSLIPFIFELKHNGAISDTTFFLALPLPGLPAPLALWLGVSAWSDLKHHPSKSGWLPTLLGLIIGFLGTLILLFETLEVVRELTARN